MSKLFFTDFFNTYVFHPERTRFVSPSVSKWDINTKEIECNGIMEPNDRVAMVSHNKEFTRLLLFYFIQKYCTSGSMVIAHIPVQSNEDSNTMCKVLFPFINSAI